MAPTAPRPTRSAWTANHPRHALAFSALRGDFSPSSPFLSRMAAWLWSLHGGLMSAKDYSRLAALIRRILVPAPWAATALRSPAPATVSGFFLLENIPNPSIL